MSLLFQDASVNQRFQQIFYNNSSIWLPSAIDCEKRFVSSVNHFVAHHPRFTPAEYQCTDSIYFTKIAISLVYGMKRSLYPDEKESRCNLFAARLNVIMRSGCTQTISIYLC